MMWILISRHHLWAEFNKRPVCTFSDWTNSRSQNGKPWQEKSGPIPVERADIPEQGETLKAHLSPQTHVIELSRGVRDLVSNFPFWRNWTQQKAGCLHGIRACVSPMELLMSLNRRMCDCDKLIDPLSVGIRVLLITGNAVQLAHIRSLTCSHNNKLTQPCLFFPSAYFFNTLQPRYLMQDITEMASITDDLAPCFHQGACYAPVWQTGVEACLRVLPRAVCPAASPASPRWSVSWSAPRSDSAGSSRSRSWWPCGCAQRSAGSGPGPASCCPGCSSPAAAQRTNKSLYFWNLLLGSNVCHRFLV